MLQERSWKQGIVRSIGAAFVVGALAGHAEIPRAVYSSPSSQTTETKNPELDATISNVTLAFQREDIKSLKKYVLPADFATFEESYNKISVQYKEGEGGFDCIAYRFVGTRPLHPGLNRDDVRLFVIWFYLPGIATGHSNAGEGSVYFTRDSNYPLGWRIKLVAEDPRDRDQDLSGEGDWVGCPYPLVETEIGKEAPKAPTEPRRFIVYQSGLTTLVDNSDSAAGKIEMFEPIQERLHKGHDRANIVNVSRDYSFDSNGNYVAGSTDCEQTLLHPYEVGVNQSNIIIELLRRHPNSYIISINHSAGGNAAMEAIGHMRFLFQRGDIPKDFMQRMNFITAHSPIQGISRSWIAEVRKFGIWSCAGMGMPNTNSPAYTYLRELWDDRMKTRADIKGDVTWFRSQRNEKEAGSGVYGLVNVPDGVIAPAQTLGFWNQFFLPIAYMRGDPLAEEILTQEIPGGQNFRRYISDGSFNHGSFFTTKEGMDFIARLVGEG